MLFFVFVKTTFFGQDSFKIFVFFIILLDFLRFLAILKVCLTLSLRVAPGRGPILTMCHGSMSI